MSARRSALSNCCGSKCSDPSHLLSRPSMAPWAMWVGVVIARSSRSVIEGLMGIWVLSTSLNGGVWLPSLTTVSAPARHTESEAEQCKASRLAVNVRSYLHCVDRVSLRTD